MAELGAYGLVASLGGYLLVLRNSVAASAVRAAAGALDSHERARMFSAAAALYALVGLATGVLVAVAALAIAGLILHGDLARDARAGGLGLGAVTAVGVAATVYLDPARRARVRARGAAGDRGRAPVPRPDARADLRRCRPRSADRGERRHPAVQRAPVRGRRPRPDSLRLVAGALRARSG